MGLNLLYGQEVAAHGGLLPLILCYILTAFSWLFLWDYYGNPKLAELMIANLAAVAVFFGFLGDF